MFNGETVEEWVALSGKQGEGQEGNINIIFSFTVRNLSYCATALLAISFGLLLQPAPPAVSYQMSAYGNQPISMAPPGMPGAQMYYAGGYPPAFPPQQQQAPVPGSIF